MDGGAIDGRYEPVGVLGRGAMGEVLRVRDRSTGEELALKRLREIDLSATRQHGRELLFRREYHTLARLTHPRIVAVGSYGVDEGLPYYTMELLDGADLRDVTGLSLVEICSVLRDLASALAFLHARGLIHRDLKSRNVRRTSDGRAKLMDFGVLATMGVVGDVAGTPPSIPPEAVRGLALDGRSDLFGLGALAYRLLVGRDAYPARSLSALPDLWKRTVVPPSAAGVEVPAALDDLVMSLLALEADARPRAAAEVVDRLTVIAELPPDPELEAQRGWLNSAALVGRDAELAAVRETIAGAMAGAGRALAFEATTGSGKTRLLREASLEGEVAGALVLSARGGAAAGPYATVRQLIENLFEKNPADTSFRLGPHAAIIGRIVPDLVSAAEIDAARVGDPVEDRLRLQDEVREWLSGLAKRRPLLLVIDDLQRADEGSVSLLAALAREVQDLPIALVVGQRSDEAPTAPEACRALAEACRSIQLHGLGKQGVVGLLRSLFGDAPGVELLGEWAHRVAGGSPMLTMELARKLVDDDLVRYEAGSWVLPQELPDDLVPPELAAALDDRVARLSKDARAVAETLAVLGIRAELGLSLRVAEARDEEVLFDALDELAMNEVIVGGARGFEFRHDGLREALLRQLAPERKRALHLRAARALELTSTDEPVSDPETFGAIGWHYLEGGESRRGAALLEVTGRSLYGVQSFFDAIAPLEAALRVYEEDGGRDSRRCLELRHILMQCGVVADRVAVLRYADETIEAFDRAAGMPLARRLSPFVGRTLALGVALAWVALRRLFGGRRRYGPVEAMTRLVVLANYAASVYSLGYRTDRLLALLAQLDPLRGVGRRVPLGAVMIIENFLHLARGTYRGVLDNATEIIDILDHDDRTPLSPVDRKLAYGSVHYMVASVRALDHDPRFEESITELGRLEMRFFDMARFTARTFFHRLRGEETHARRNADSSAVLGVQLGNAWVFRSQLAWIDALAYSFAEDAAALKRSVEVIEHMVERGYRFDPLGSFAAAEHLRVSGGAAAAVEVATDALAQTREDDLFMRQLLHIARADALLASGREDEAVRAVEEGLALRVLGDEGLATLRMRLQLTGVRARCRQGDHDGVAAELEALSGRALALGSPVLIGMVHEAAAFVHREAGDVAGAGRAEDEASLSFRATGNPVLVARAERLARRGRARSTTTETAGIEDTGTGDAETTVETSATPHPTPVDSPEAPG